MSTWRRRLFIALIGSLSFGWEMMGYEDIHLGTAIWVLAIAGIIWFGWDEPTFKRVLPKYLDNSRNRALASVGAAAIVAILMVVFIWPSKEELQLRAEHQAKQHIGKILPADEAMPYIHCASRPKNNEVVVFLGKDKNNRSIGYIHKNPMTIIEMNGENILTVDTQKGELLLTAHLYTDNGEILAQIEQNVWRVAQYAPWYDRPDAHTLIVYDNNGRKILFVRFIRRNAMEIMGVFRSSDGRQFIIIDTDTIGSNKFHFRATCFENIWGSIFRIH